MTAFATLSRTPRQIGTVALTAVTISHLQKWLGRLGYQAILVIERQGDRNRVALRLSGLGGIAEFEAAWLYALREQHLQPEEVRRKLAGANAH